MNLKGRHLLTLKDFTPEEIHYLLKVAKQLKAKKQAGERGTLLERKNIVLLLRKHRPGPGVLLKWQPLMRGRK